MDQNPLGLDIYEDALEQFTDRGLATVANQQIKMRVKTEENKGLQSGDENLLENQDQYTQRDGAQQIPQSIVKQNNKQNSQQPIPGQQDQNSARTQFNNFINGTEAQEPQQIKTARELNQKLQAQGYNLNTQNNNPKQPQASRPQSSQSQNSSNSIDINQVQRLDINNTGAQKQKQPKQNNFVNQSPSNSTQSNNLQNVQKELETATLARMIQMEKEYPKKMLTEDEQNIVNEIEKKMQKNKSTIDATDKFISDRPNDATVKQVSQYSTNKNILQVIPKSFIGGKDKFMKQLEQGISSPEKISFTDSGIIKIDNSNLLFTQDQFSTPPEKEAGLKMTQAIFHQAKKNHAIQQNNALEQEIQKIRDPSPELVAIQKAIDGANKTVNRANQILDRIKQSEENAKNKNDGFTQQKPLSPPRQSLPPTRNYEVQDPSGIKPSTQMSEDELKKQSQAIQASLNEIDQNKASIEQDLAKINDLVAESKKFTQDTNQRISDNVASIDEMQKAIKAIKDANNEKQNNLGVLSKAGDLTNDDRYRNAAGTNSISLEEMKLQNNIGKLQIENQTSKLNTQKQQTFIKDCESRASELNQKKVELDKQRQGLEQSAQEISNVTKEKQVNKGDISKLEDELQKLNQEEAANKLEHNNNTKTYTDNKNTFIQERTGLKNREVSTQEEFDKFKKDIEELKQKGADNKNVYLTKEQEFTQKQEEIQKKKDLLNAKISDLKVKNGEQVAPPDQQNNEIPNEPKSNQIPKKSNTNNQQPKTSELDSILKEKEASFNKLLQEKQEKEEQARLENERQVAEQKQKEEQRQNQISNLESSLQQNESVIDKKLQDGQAIEAQLQVIENQMEQDGISAEDFNKLRQSGIDEIDKLNQLKIELEEAKKKAQDDREKLNELGQNPQDNNQNKSIDVREKQDFGVVQANKLKTSLTGKMEGVMQQYNAQLTATQEIAKQGIDNQNIPNILQQLSDIDKNLNTIAQDRKTAITELNKLQSTIPNLQDYVKQNNADAMKIEQEIAKAKNGIAQSMTNVLQTMNAQDLQSLQDAINQSPDLQNNNITQQFQQQIDNRQQELQQQQDPPLILFDDENKDQEINPEQQNENQPTPPQDKLDGKGESLEAQNIEITFDDGIQQGKDEQKNKVNEAAEAFGKFGGGIDKYQNQEPQPEQLEQPKRMTVWDQIQLFHEQRRKHLQEIEAKRKAEEKAKELRRKNGIPEPSIFDGIKNWAKEKYQGIKDFFSPKKKENKSALEARKAFANVSDRNEYEPEPTKKVDLEKDFLPPDQTKKLQEAMLAKMNQATLGLKNQDVKAKGKPKADNLEQMINNMKFLQEGSKVPDGHTAMKIKVNGQTYTGIVPTENTKALVSNTPMTSVAPRKNGIENQNVKMSPEELLKKGEVLKQEYLNKLDKTMNTLNEKKFRGQDVKDIEQPVKSAEKIISKEKATTTKDNFARKSNPVAKHSDDFNIGIKQNPNNKSNLEPDLTKTTEIRPRTETQLNKRQNNLDDINDELGTNSDKKVAKNPETQSMPEKQNNESIKKKIEPLSNDGLDKKLKQILESGNIKIDPSKKYKTADDNFPPKQQSTGITH
ncbi:Smc domain-containing protein [Candidatus Deianiraea vastatrix]|uniref:Uncharacterized protein n=1 Tax=Candidatus Deianiraea vastatrix TaxID=2163644 RepID=A0A5B8XC78_9RICK|nr:hypothetical protein [Candidatus Deianiraea vastatrix]QED22942.1 hypothetical protein Deia_00130 [Candidatus Deianiraea vastatrix]